MKFEVLPSDTVPDIRVIYRPDEYSFDYESAVNLEGGASVLVNDLQLEIDLDGCVTYAWGLSPHTSWKYTDYLPPKTIKARLIVKLDTIIIPGISYRLMGSEVWPTWINPQHRWICFGDPSVSQPFIAIEFAHDSVAVLKDGMLKSIWLHPQVP